MVQVNLQVFVYKNSNPSLAHWLYIEDIWGLALTMCLAKQKKENTIIFVSVKSVSSS